MRLPLCFQRINLVVACSWACLACGSSFGADDPIADATSPMPTSKDAMGSISYDVGAAETKVAEASVMVDGSSDRGAPRPDVVHDDSARDAVADVTPACSPTSAFGAPMLIHGGANSADDDFAPRLSRDELNIYFARRAIDNPTAPTHIYVATRPTAASPFDAAIALAVNSTSNDVDPMIASDGLTLFFSSDRQNGSGEFDVYWSHRASTSVPFTSASPVPTVNSPGSELQPFLASDGELWFSYRKPGLTSALHIRRAPRAGTGWDSPVAVTELDSTVDDMWPLLTNDKLTIYLSSSRVNPVAQAKANVWTAHRSSPTLTFDMPSSVIEVNSPATDLPGWISPDNCRLYLSSNRSPLTGYDIYVAER